MTNSTTTQRGFLEGISSPLVSQLKSWLSHTNLRIQVSAPPKLQTPVMASTAVQKSQNLPNANKCMTNKSTLLLLNHFVKVSLPSTWHTLGTSA